MIGDYHTQFGGMRGELALSIKFVLYGACFACVCLAVYVFPYHWHLFGLPADASLTSAAGYDRRAEFVFLIGVMAAFAAVFSAYAHPATNRDFVTVADEPRSNRKLRLAAMLSAIGFVGIIWFHAANVTDNYFETYYFTIRLEEMSLGKVPYYDFLFNYGPLLIYLPFLIMKLTGLTAIKAYFLGLASVFVAALYIYYLLVHRLPVPASRKWVIYIAALAFWVPISYSTGLHYALLRFLMPIALAFFLPGLLEKSKPWIAFVGLVAATASCVLLSFETGLSFVAAATAACVYCAIKERRRVLWAVLALHLSLVAATIVALPRGFLQDLISNGGGREFPAIPSMFSLVFFACVTFSVLTAGNRLWTRLFQKRGADDSRETGLDFIVVAATALLPGALGRQDFGHLYAYGFGFFLFTLALASSQRNRTVLIYVAGVIGTLSLAYNTITATFVGKTFLRGPLVQSAVALADTYAHPLLCAVASECGKTLRSEPPPPPFDESSTQNLIETNYPNIYDPFMILSPSAHVDTGYYTGMNDVINLHAMNIKTSELRSHAYYVLSANFDDTRNGYAVNLSDEAWVYRYISLYPFRISLAGGTPAADRPAFFEQLEKYCVRVLEKNGYIICRNAGYTSSPGTSAASSVLH